MALSAFSFPLSTDQSTPRVYYELSGTAPTSGPFVLGDVIINLAPSVGQPIFWTVADDSPLTLTPIGVLGGLGVQALTAAGTVSTGYGIVTTSGFAGNVTLSPAQSQSGQPLQVIALSTHAVTLVAASGNAIVGLNGALSSTIAAANLTPSGTNWYRTT